MHDFICTPLEDLFLTFFVLFFCVINKMHDFVFIFYACKFKQRSVGQLENVDRSTKSEPEIQEKDEEELRAKRIEILLGQAPTQATMSRIDDVCKRVRLLRCTNLLHHRNLIYFYFDSFCVVVC